MLRKIRTCDITGKEIPENAKYITGVMNRNARKIDASGNYDVTPVFGHYDISEAGAFIIFEKLTELQRLSLLETYI